MTPDSFSLVIVEDQPLMRTALSAVVAQEGLTVLAEIGDSGHAVQIASNLTPDMILFSVKDPDSRDLETISALRQQLPAVSLVALVTGDFHGQYQAALDSGAHLVLTKAMPRADILTALVGMLQKNMHPAAALVE